MKSLDQILDEVDRFTPIDDAASVAGRLLGLAECILERWIEARGDAPTAGTREGFRLLALHRQGAQDAPSFNACRETCREIVYHYNLLTGEPTSVKVLYFTQLLGIALGLSPRSLGIHENVSDGLTALKAKGLA